MQSYFYVDIDDEITTIIGKLRADKESKEVFLVVPKRALIAQSLVNLQLMDKEAKKIGKKLIFVSPDSHTRKIAEKAGLEVKKYVAKPEELKNLEAEEKSSSTEPRKLSPEEEAAAKRELNAIMGKPEEQKTIASPPPVKIRPGVFSSQTTFNSPQGNFSQRAVAPRVVPPPVVPVVPVPIMPIIPIPNLTPAVPAKKEEEKNPVINLKKIEEEKRSSLLSQGSTERPKIEVEENPFKVRSITERKEETKPEVISAERVNNFNHQDKELANLTLREKERLRDLWMEQKGVVRGKFFQSSSNLDLRDNPAEGKIRSENLPESNSGLIKTTRRKIVGSGKVVDLRSRAIPLGGNSSSTLKKKDKKEILLPLANVRFFSFFVVVIFSVLLIVAGIILPKAKIEIVSKNKIDTFELGLRVNGETAEINVSEKIIPGKPVRFKIIQESSFSVAEEREVKNKAQGQATFSNSGETEINLKKGATLVSEKGRKYVTLSAVKIPASSVAVVDNENTNSAGTTTAGTASIEIAAVDFGEEYNLKSGSILVVGVGDENAVLNLKSTVGRAITGGEIKKVKIVSEKDIEKAKEELTSRIKEKSSEEAKKYFDSKNTEILFPTEAGLEEISFSSSKNKDEIASSFDAKIEGSFFGLTFSASDSRRVAEEVVEPDDSKRQGEIKLKDFRVVNFNPVENQMEISGNFEYQEKLNPQTVNIEKELVAKSRKEGENFLSKNSEIESYDIKIFPSWLPWFPLLEKNIEIKTK